MASKSKLTLLLELKNKLFNNKLMDSKRKLSKATDKMRGKIDRLRSNTVKSFTAMRNEIPLFGRAMDLLGNPYVLLTAGLIAVGTFYVKATGEAKKFNHEFLQIQNLNLDKSNKSIATYKVGIRDMAFETGHALVDSTKAIYDLQSATGKYGNEALAIYKKVANYSTATGSQVGDSMNATTKAMKAFGLGVNDIDAYLASNAKTVQVGITTFAELSRVQTEYAGAAAGAGQSVDTANKLFAAFTSIAKDSRTAATMTKTAFMGLTQDATIKGLKSIGIKMYDANGQMRDLGNVLGDVTRKFKNMTPQEIDVLINKIGGPEGLRALFTKLKTGADDFHNTLTAFDASKYDMSKALGNAQKDVTILSSMVKNRFNTIMARLGEKTLPLVESVLNGINNVLGWLYNNFDTIGDVVESLAMSIGIVTGALVLFEGVALISSIASVGLAASFWNVAGAIYGIGKAVLAIPVIGWIIAIIAVVIYLVKRTEGWRKQWENLSEFFKNTMKIMGLRIRTSWDDTIDGLLDGIDKARKKWYEFKNALNIGDKDVNTQAINNISKGMTQRFMDSEMRKAGLQRALDNKADLKWKLSWKKSSSKKAKTDENLLGASTQGNGDGDNTNFETTASKQINNTASGSSGGGKSITIENITLNKGGINTQNTTLAHMTAEEIEAWMQEAFMRVIRGVELAN